MEAFVIFGTGETGMIDKPEPSPGPGEVRIKVRCVGLCGTDLNIFRGLNPLVSYPRIPGHEIGGEIMETGADVSGCRVGDRVVVIPYTECGHCASCRSGRINACESNETMGVQRDGAMTETIIAPASKLLVRNDLSFDRLALVEPLAVGMRVARRARIDIGEEVVVFGCGVIGLGAIAAAAAMGGRVTAVDIDDRKRDIAMACGATHFFNSAENDIAALRSSIDQGRGPAAVLEAVGAEATYRDAIDLVSFAGRVIYVGYAKHPITFDTSLFVKKELDIRGSRNATARDFDAVLSLMEQDKYPIEQLITSRYPLPEAGRALRDWSSDPGGVTKFVIDIH